MAEPEDRSPLDLLCDLLVYAPVGFAFEAPKLVPELASKGRDQVAQARSIGQFVVRQAGTRLGPLVGSLLSGVVSGLGQRNEPPSGERDGTPRPVVERAAGSPAVAVDVAPDEALGVSDGRPDASPTAQAVISAVPVPPDTRAALAASAEEAGASAVEPDAPPVESLAIPHYDSLAASQVVPRLAQLSVEELRAVQGYESAHRGRRTVLNRTEQLLARARERA